MKRYLSILCLLFTLAITFTTVTAQNCPVLTNPNLTDVQGGLLDPNGLSEAQSVRFNITILNMDEKQVIKKGNCEIKIELGEKLKLPENGNISKAAYGDYFTWSVVMEKGNVCLYGKLIDDLPANFTGMASFNLQCNGKGSSMVKTYWINNADRTNTTALNTVVFTIIPKASAGVKN